MFSLTGGRKLFMEYSGLKGPGRFTSQRKERVSGISSTGNYVCVITNLIFILNGAVGFDEKLWFVLNDTNVQRTSTSYYVIRVLTF